jgi:Fe2+ or Zn2+ uptake regulation protein
MTSDEIYVRFLKLAQAINANELFISMDLRSQKLLEVIAISHASAKPLTVTAAMGLSYIASPATIHRKLDQLRELGLIDLVFESKNRRTKFLVPTNDALTYFDAMGKAVLAAADTNR